MRIMTVIYNTDYVRIAKYGVSLLIRLSRIASVRCGEGPMGQKKIHSVISATRR